MDNFNFTSKAVILVTIYIALSLQNKIFIDTVQKRFISESRCGKSTKSLGALLHFFAAPT